MGNINERRILQITTDKLENLNDTQISYELFRDEDKLSWFGGGFGGKHTALDKLMRFVEFGTIPVFHSMVMGINSNRNVVITSHDELTDNHKNNLNSTTRYSTTDDIGERTIGSINIGYMAGQNQSGGTYGISIGNKASLNSNNATGIVIGYQSGMYASVGNCIIIGTNSHNGVSSDSSILIGRGLRLAGSYNIAMGYLAGKSLNTNNSIFFGRNVGLTGDSTTLLNTGLYTGSSYIFELGNTPTLATENDIQTNEVGNTRINGLLLSGNMQEGWIWANNMFGIAPQNQDLINRYTPRKGFMVYNNTLNTPQFYDGSKWVSFDSGGSGNIIPTGGTAGQVLTKASNTDFDIEWGYIDTSIPTLESVLTAGNDAGGQSIINVSMPTGDNVNDLDVANRKFVNDTIASENLWKRVQSVTYDDEGNPTYIDEDIIEPASNDNIRLHQPINQGGRTAYINIKTDDTIAPKIGVSLGQGYSGGGFSGDNYIDQDGIVSQRNGSTSFSDALGSRGHRDNLTGKFTNNGIAFTGGSTYWNNSVSGSAYSTTTETESYIHNSGNGVVLSTKGTITSITGSDDPVIESEWNNAVTFGASGVKTNYTTTQILSDNDNLMSVGAYKNITNGRYVYRSGDTMIGQLNVPNAIADTNALNRITADGRYANKTHTPTAVAAQNLVYNGTSGRKAINTNQFLLMLKSKGAFTNGNGFTIRGTWDYANNDFIYDVGGETNLVSTNGEAIQLAGATVEVFGTYDWSASGSTGQCMVRITTAPNIIIDNSNPYRCYPNTTYVLRQHNSIWDNNWSRDYSELYTTTTSGKPADGGTCAFDGASLAVNERRKISGIINDNQTRVIRTGRVKMRVINRTGTDLTYGYRAGTWVYADASNSAIGCIFDASGNASNLFDTERCAGTQIALGRIASEPTGTWTSYELITVEVDVDIHRIPTGLIPLVGKKISTQASNSFPGSLVNGEVVTARGCLYNPTSAITSLTLSFPTMSTGVRSVTGYYSAPSTAPTFIVNSDLASNSLDLNQKTRTAVIDLTISRTVGSDAHNDIVTIQGTLTFEGTVPIAPGRNDGTRNIFYRFAVDKNLLSLPLFTWGGYTNNNIKLQRL